MGQREGAKLLLPLHVGFTPQEISRNGIYSQVDHLIIALVSTGDLQASIVHSSILL